MSRAFVKETEMGSEELPDRPVSQHPNDVTPAGLDQIDAALDAARAAYAAAQAVGSRSGLADAARDLRYWTSRRSTAQVVTPSAPNGSVRFGTTVTVVRDDGREQTLRIVGEDEADPKQGTLSHVAPLARALYGKRAGDVVSVAGHEAEIRSVT